MRESDAPKGRRYIVERRDARERCALPGMCRIKRACKALLHQLLHLQEPRIAAMILPQERYASRDKPRGVAVPR